MTKRVVRRPQLGPDFDVQQMDKADRFQAYINTLRWYVPDAELIAQGETLLGLADDLSDQSLFEYETKCDDYLTEWAREVDKNNYISFGSLPNSADVGFYYDVQAALEDADLRIAAGDAAPKGFTGLLAEVTDHGNVTISNYSRGRRTRTLFSVV